MPNCGSWDRPAISSRLPRSIGATSSATSPSSASGRGEQVGCRAVDRRGVGQARAARGPARSCGRCRRRRASRRPGKPIVGRRDRGCSASATTRSSAIGTPWAARSAFESGSDRVRGGVGQTVGEPTQGLSRRPAPTPTPPVGFAAVTWAIRGLIEGFYGTPWTLGRTARCAGLVPAPARHDALRLRAQGRPEAPGRLARAVRRRSELDGFRSLVDGAAWPSGSASRPASTSTSIEPAERTALAAKVDQVSSCGVGLVVLALDDLPTAGIDPVVGAGVDHAAAHRVAARPPR